MLFASTLWTAVFGLVGVAITVSATLFGIWWKHQLETKAKGKTQENAVQATRIMRNAISLAFDQLRVKRLLFLRIDCDKDTLIDEKATFYITAIEEERRDPLPSLSQMLQLYQVDDVYKETVIHPMMQGREIVRVHTDVLPPCSLKNVFLAQHILMADMVSVLRVADHIWMFSVHHVEDIEHTPLYLATLDTLRHTLQTTLRKSPDAGL